MGALAVVPSQDPGVGSTDPRARGRGSRFGSCSCTIELDASYMGHVLIRTVKADVGAQADVRSPSSPADDVEWRLFTAPAFDAKAARLGLDLGAVGEAAGRAPEAPVHVIPSLVDI